jgi:transposase-like protein
MTSLKQIHEQFDTQDKCMAFLVEMRWPEGVHCPRCNSEKVHKLKHRPWNWQCKACQKNGYRFSPLVGTVFENTNYPLPIWFEVIYLICQSKKGMSALQVQRMLKDNGRPTAYKTAFYICHRVRAMLDNPDFPPLMGVVEVDETYIGGKDRNRHWNKKSAQQRAAAGELPLGDKIGYGKVGVIGAIERKGNVVCKVFGDASAETLSGFVRNVVSDKVSLLATDKKQEYRYVDRRMQHAAVHHSQGEYVRGAVHTNNIESFWSLLKRGVVGTYHNVSKKYLPLYLNEFSWRFNHRKDPDIFRSAMAGC